MLRKPKPTTSGIRQVTYEDFTDITRKQPEKGLTVRQKKHSGRNRFGRISVRHRGGGARKLYRLVDFKQKKLGVPAEVLAIQYDPNRSARIALIRYQDNSKTYILAPLGLKVSDKILVDVKTDLAIGNRMKLKNIPLGTPIHNLELQPGKGGQMVRSAGQQASIVAKKDSDAHVKLPSGEMRRISLESFASIGQLSNPDHSLITIGKAGRMRHMGVRPTVRGKAMYPAAHPHGGGEGVSPIGLKYPKTPWGKPALGVKTRRNKRTDKFILQRRK